MARTKEARTSGVIESRDAAPPASRTLVLFDADLPSVLALAYAAEQSALAPAPAAGVSSLRLPGAGAAHATSPGDRDHAPPLLLPSYAGMPDARERAQALTRAIDLLGAERAGDEPPDVAARPELDGPGETRLLVHAAYLALESGCDTIVWPVQLGEDLRAADPTVDRVARAIDRAMLVSRLVGLDAHRALGGVEIQTPFVDLSDRQLAELVMDIEAPLAACWWWGGPTPSAQSCQDRWGTLLRSLGWGGALGPS